MYRERETETERDKKVRMSEAHGNKRTGLMTFVPMGVLGGELYIGVKQSNYIAIATVLSWAE